MVFTSLSAVLQMFNSDASRQIIKFLDCLLVALSVGGKNEKCSKPLDRLHGFTRLFDLPFIQLLFICI